MAVTTSSQTAPRRNVPDRFVFNLERIGNFSDSAGRNWEVRAGREPSTVKAFDLFRNEATNTCQFITHVVLRSVKSLYNGLLGTS